MNTLFIKKYLLIPMLLLLLCITTGASENQLIVVLITAEEEPGVIQYIERIQEQLAPYNILIVDDLSEISSDMTAIADLSIHHNHWNLTRHSVSISIHTHILSDISPILRDTTLMGVTGLSNDSENLVIGAILYATGDVDGAETYLSLVNEQHIFIGGTEFLLGNLALLNEDYESAIAYFEDYTVAIPNLAWLYHQVGRSEDAISLISERIAYNHSTNDKHAVMNMLVLRSQLFALDFDYDSAIADIDEAISVSECAGFSDMAMAELYTTRGEIIFLIYEWDRVEESFNTAIELDPAYAPAYFQRGILFYTMARREDAMTDFETYLELEPDGFYIDDAESYIESIQIELDALNG